MLNLDTLGRLLEAIAMDRLVVLCGAGLSMAPPSKLPSAAALAAHCRDRYVERIPLDTAVLPTELEDIARYFYNRDRLQDFFLGFLVRWELMRGPTNEGHEAIADLLACGALTAAVTTNFDRLIEAAGDRLGEPDFRAIVEVADLPQEREHRPLLKIHGCAERQRLSTVWCKEQLNDEPVKTRVKAFQDWLRATLYGRDLLIIGFWTDWAYFGDLLAESLQLIGPRTVTLVAPDSAAELERKAPDLWKWAHSPGIDFFHESMSAESFLAELRHYFSRGFVQQALATCTTTADAAFGPCASNADLSGFSMNDLYALRRDLCGEPATAPVRLRVPSADASLAAGLIRQLLSSGWAYSAHHFTYGTRRIRVVFGRGRMLGDVKRRFEGEPAVFTENAEVVCVGAVDDPSPTNIARGIGKPTIMRGGPAGSWYTLNDWLDVHGGIPA